MSDFTIDRDTLNAASPGFGAVAVGALAGGVGAVVGAALTPGRRLDLGAVELGFIAGAYPAMALREESPRAVVLESAASAMFIGLAAYGLRRRSRLGIAAGLLGHAVWDVVHHLYAIGTKTPRWFPAFCSAADVALAIQFVRAQ
ncbi:MAG TPA: hypothetical protein VFV03_02635 [Solirubrobacteraceae bacterium]|nr:hypothetical protein [Solirubrobacteraceae bacterium]